jgi:hypothetical protein
MDFNNTGGFKGFREIRGFKEIRGPKGVNAPKTPKRFLVLDIVT